MPAPCLAFSAIVRTLKSPIQRVNVDFTETMLEELDTIGNELNIQG